MPPRAILRLLAALVLPVALAACGAVDRAAPLADVQRAAYRHNAPASLTLYTAISNNTGAGGHSGLLINGSQRVMFDPAGTWWNRRTPERGDVIYGMTDPALDLYVDYHARVTYHVVVQEVRVSPEVAEQALQIVQSYGAVGKSMCARSISDVLSRLPGFESVGRTWFPRALMEDFARLPGVTEAKVFDDSPDNNKGLLDAPIGG